MFVETKSPDTYKGLIAFSALYRFQKWRQVPLLSTTLTKITKLRQNVSLNMHAKIGILNGGSRLSRWLQ